MFTSLERWKEEVLLLQEELRRLGVWYQHSIQASEESIIASIGEQPSLHLLGWKTLMRERIYNLKLEYREARDTSRFVI